MTANTVERHDLIVHDRLFYANLWGNTSRSTRTREVWRSRRARSGLLALVALGVLLSYLAAGLLVGGQASGPSTAPTDPGGAAVTQEPHSGN